MSTQNEVVNFDREFTLHPGEVQYVKRASNRDKTRTAKPDNLYIMHSQLSKDHAELTNDNGILKLKDTDSSFGTFINNQYLLPGKTYKLVSGDTVSFIMLKSYDQIRQKIDSLQDADRPIMLADFGSPKTLLNFEIRVLSMPHDVVDVGFYYKRTSDSPSAAFDKISKFSDMGSNEVNDDATIAFNDGDDDSCIEIVSHRDASGDSSGETAVEDQNLSWLDKEFAAQKAKALADFHSGKDEHSEEEMSDSDEDEEETTVPDAVFYTKCREALCNFFTANYDGEDDTDDYTENSGSSDASEDEDTRIDILEFVQDSESGSSESDDSDYDAPNRTVEVEEADDSDDLESESESVDLADEVLFLSKPKKSLAQLEKEWQDQREDAMIAYLQQEGYPEDEDGRLVELDGDDSGSEEECSCDFDDGNDIPEEDLHEFYVRDYDEDTEDEDYNDDGMYYVLTSKDPSTPEQPKSKAKESKARKLIKAVSKEAARVLVYGSLTVVALAAYGSMNQK